MVGAGFYVARLTTKTCLPSVGICRQIQLRKLKTPGGILVFRVLVQVWFLGASWHRKHCHNFSYLYKWHLYVVLGIVLSTCNIHVYSDYKWYPSLVTIQAWIGLSAGRMTWEQVFTCCPLLQGLHLENHFCWFDLTWLDVEKLLSIRTHTYLL